MDHVVEPVDPVLAVVDVNVLVAMFLSGSDALQIILCRIVRLSVKLRILVIFVDYLAGSVFLEKIEKFRFKIQSDFNICCQIRE